MKKVYRRWGGTGRVVRTLCFKREDGVDHKVFFVVSKYRRKGDYEKVMAQEAMAAHAKLSSYGQSLFDSCFKGW